MKIPFSNDTSQVIKRLAKRSIASDKRRNLFVIITIAFTAAIITALSFWCAAKNRSVIDDIRGQYQAVAMDTTEEQIAHLIKQNEVEQYGISKNLGGIRYQDTTLSVSYEDENWVALNRRKFSGTLPEKETDILVERAFLDYFNLPQKTGQTLLLDLGSGEQSYQVTGIIEKENPARYFEVVVSREYVLAHSNGTPLFEFRLRYRDGDRLEPALLKEQIFGFLTQNGIDRNNIFYSSNYFDMADFRVGNEKFIIPLALLILMAASLVIYSIFYISVSGKIREYGRLKVLGTTPKQLRRIVRREGFYLSLRGIPAGVVAGGLIGYLLEPEYWNWPGNAALALAVAAATEATVLLSTHKPVSLAAKVSPIEALRTTAYSVETKKHGRKKQAETRHLSRRITPSSLAHMNFNRSRKKTTFTMLSLGLTGVFLVISSSITASLSPEDFARNAMGDGSTYSLNWVDSVSLEEIPDTARNNPLTKELRDKIMNLDSVEDITSYGLISAEIEMPRKADSFTILAPDKQQMDALLPKSNMKEGTADYDALTEGCGVIITDSSEHFFKKFWDYEPKLGDVLHLKTYGGQDMDVTVMGIAKSDSTASTGIGATLITMPQALAQKIYPDISNMDVIFNVHTPSDSETLRKAIYSAADDPLIMVTAQSDFRLSYESILKTLFFSVLLLMGLLFIFAVINLVNTLMTNLLSRQQEFGVLQSVGLSGKQLSKMLSMECFWYVASTLAIGLVFGSALSFLIIRIMNQFKLFSNMTFHFPFLPFAAFALALLVIQALYSIFAVRYMRKRSLVERINLMA